MADFTITDSGSIMLLKPETDAARAWTDEHIGDEAQWFCRAVVVEPRYMQPIIDGIEGDGLTVACL